MGSGELFRAPFTSTSDAEIGFISAMVVDDLNKRVFVGEAAETGKAKLFSIDLATGNRTVISATSLDNSPNQITSATQMLLAGNRNYVLWADAESHQIIAIDVATGARVVFSQ